MKTVAVLMSTYNGENYIKEQIDSILRQEKLSVVLVVRDDGSSDRTVEILKEYESDGKLVLRQGANLGVGNSFMDLLYHAPDADYYAFADQDDIWMENKLSVATDKIDQRGGAVIYSSNQMLVDGDGRKMGLRYKKPPFTKLFPLIDRNILCGCTMVMNKEMASVMREEKRRPSPQLLRKRLHDSWLLQAGCCIGSVIYDEQSYILYRQHGNNVVGAKRMSLWKRLGLYVKVLLGKNQGHIRTWTADELRRCFGELVSGEEKEVLDLYAGLDTFRGRKRFLSAAYAKQITGNRMLFRLKVWLGLI